MKTAGISAAFAIALLSSLATAAPSSRDSRDAARATLQSRAAQVAMTHAQTGPQTATIDSLPKPALAGKDVAAGPGAKASWLGTARFGRARVDRSTRLGREHVTQTKLGIWQRSTQVKASKQEVPSGTVETNSTASTNDRSFFHRADEHKVSSQVDHDRTKTTTEVHVKERGVRTTAHVKVTREKPGEAPVVEEATAVSKNGRAPKLAGQ